MERARERLEQYACYKLSYMNHAFLFDCFSSLMFLAKGREVAKFHIRFSSLFFAKAD